jgi:uncharacterized protein
LKQAILIPLLTTLLILHACKPNPATKEQITANTASQAENTPNRLTDTIPGSMAGDTFNIPQARGLVNDFSSVFTAAQLKTLDSMVNEYEQKTSIEIAIVTLRAAQVNKEDFDRYTLQMANHWGIGQKYNNNGILVAVAPELARMRIHNGYGIEKMMSDQETKTIVDSFFIPYYKKGDYFNGTREGVIVIMERLKARQ